MVELPLVLGFREEEEEEELEDKRVEDLAAPQNKDLGGEIGDDRDGLGFGEERIILGVKERFGGFGVLKLQDWMDGVGSRGGFDPSGGIGGTVPFLR